MAGGLLHPRLEELDNFCCGHPLERAPFPTPLDHVPNALRNLRMSRPRWSVVLEDREDGCRFDLSGKWRLPGEDLVMGQYLEIEMRDGPAYLPSEHPKGEHIRCFGSACVDEPKGVRFDKFGSSPTEESPRLDVGPADREREGESGPQAAQTSHPILVDQYVPLGKSEHPVPEYERADTPS